MATANVLHLMGNKLCPFSCILSPKVIHSSFPCLSPCPLQVVSQQQFTLYTQFTFLFSFQITANVLLGNQELPLSRSEGILTWFFRGRKALPQTKYPRAGRPGSMTVCHGAIQGFLAHSNHSWMKVLASSPTESGSGSTTPVFLLQKTCTHELPQNLPAPATLPGNYTLLSTFPYLSLLKSYNQCLEVQRSDEITSKSYIFQF